MPRNSRPVYSTSTGRLCPECGLPVANCRCREPSAEIPKGGIVRVGRETAGRKGAGVTVVTGLLLGADDLAALASKLKKRCGSGGTARDGRIEIQGEHRDTLVAELRKIGYTVRRSGG
ncbi:MAG TPA: translation initiation factor Sui1 [Gemmatimonadales bacterium]|nr:translation initiation factor Sui1 [Gemmatimonadales bacterium]